VSATSPAPAVAPRIDLERWVPLPPLVLVNIVAVYGQYGWAEANLPGITVGGATLPLWAVLFAAALESIAIYLSYEAHKARMAGDSSAKLWAAAYAVAFLAGALNYWHLADPVTHQPTPAAVAFAAMSLLSPWLWGIRSRSMNRDLLRKLDLIEPRAVKFSTARWVLFPAATFRAFRAAVWAGETNPRAAIAMLEQPAAAESVATDPAPVAAREVEAVTDVAPMPVVKAKAIAKGPKAAPAREQARTILLALDSLDAKTNAELARQYGGSDTYWRQRKDDVRAELADMTREARSL
jgi:hypothetical protein